MPRGESLDSLRNGYQALYHAGRGSLSAAYQFGMIVDSLSVTYTYAGMGDVIGKSAAVPYTYARLYRKYSSEHALLRKAEEMGTYDVGKLAGLSAPGPGPVYVLHCDNCDSTSFHRERDREAEQERARQLADAN